MSLIERIQKQQEAETELFLQRLKQLKEPQLEKLAQRLRQRIIGTVARNGGHLASNLGVVELSIALHRAFNSPRDKIIWDVGHQSYVHKLLTGRQKDFSTLRQFRGLSGFPKRHESPHDVYETGHSSTSISAALGLALARDLQQEDHHVVAVIGDGALTGGMAFEAMNQAGHCGSKLIIVLNDNEMSISENVGALSHYLNEIRVRPGYFRTKQSVKQLLGKLPSGGEEIIQFVQRVKASAQHMVLPGVYFEDLGLSYLGPVDGHSFASLDVILEQAKAAEGPVLVHVCTTKGKGYLPAERSPDHFHGIAPFDKKTGELLSASQASFTSVFSEEMLALAAEDERTVAITAAMPVGTGLSAFAESYPQRFFDVGIAEQHAVTLAAGLAVGGMKPVVAVYSSFMQRALDQVIEDVALQNLPVTFALDRAGLVGEDGETHHGMFDLSFMRLVPNISILAPKNFAELRGMLRLSRRIDGPVAIRYPRGSGESGEVVDDPRDLLHAEVCRPGIKNWIVAVGPLVYSALEVAERLQKEGLLLGVINLRVVKPLDLDILLPILRQTSNLITLEENTLKGGAGSALLELCQQEELKPRSLLLGLPDRFIEHGRRDQLLKELQLDTDSLCARIGRFLNDDWSSQLGDAFASLFSEDN